MGVKKLLQCYVHRNCPISLIQRGKGSSGKFILALNSIKGILILILRATTPSSRWSINEGENRQKFCRIIWLFYFFSISGFSVSLTFDYWAFGKIQKEMETVELEHFEENSSRKPAEVKMSI